MDPITQGLLGATTAQLGFRQRIGRDASWVAAAAGILPDLDVLVMPILSLSGAEVDGLTRLTIHRGLSHSLLMAPIFALPVAFIWWWLRNRRPKAGSLTSRERKRAGDTTNTAANSPAPSRSRLTESIRSPNSPAPSRISTSSVESSRLTANASPSFWLLYGCVFVAVFTHPLLDWCTSYGTRLLSPLSAARYAIDAVPIVDIIYTPLLILTLLVCYVVRKFRGGRAIRATLIVGWAGFLLSVGYIAAGRVMHNRAVEKACRLAGGAKIVRADAYPAIGTIFLWRTVVEAEDEWLVARVHHFSSKPPLAKSAPKADSPWIRKAMELPEAETYRWFADGRLRPDYALENGHHVVKFHDMRYGWPIDSTESMWPMIVIFSSDGELLHIGREHPVRRGGFRSVAARAWAEIWNP